MLICIHCHGPLQRQSQGEYACSGCGAVFARNLFGYSEMLSEKTEIDSTSEEYAEDQRHCGQSVSGLFLRPLIEQLGCRRILDAGCGIGEGVAALQESGYDAYGIDLPSLSRFWASEKRDREHFFAASATNLPFSDGTFDLVYSFGVVEHIGTVAGHCTLAADYGRQRRSYAEELLRVTKPGGRILIACPNKTFPIDIQHGPGDEIEPAGKVRSLIFEKTGLNLHKTWGRYHLLSYREVKDLFQQNGNHHQFQSLPLRNYFQFGRFSQGFLKPFVGVAKLWVEHMPEAARQSFLNPYVMVEIKK